MECDNAVVSNQRYCVIVRIKHVSAYIDKVVKQNYNFNDL